MKKLSIKTIYKPVLLFLLMLMPVLATAQSGTGFGDGDGEGDDVDDEVAPPTPINGYTAAVLITGCALGYILLRRREKLS